MIFNTDDTPLFSSITLSQAAEKELISNLLQENFLSDPVLHRDLASYAITDEMEKDRLILDLLNILWKKYSLQSQFTVFRDFDTFFAVLGKRGHFIHQFEVFLLGWYLIRRLMKFKPVSKRLANFGNVREIFLAWLITSTAHDFGYPLTTASKLIATLAELYQKLGAQNLSDNHRFIQRMCDLTTEVDLINMKTLPPNGKEPLVDIRKIIADGIKETLRIDNASAEALLKSLECKNNDGYINHGYISAVLLCNAYIRNLPYGSFSPRGSKDLDRLKLASAAIALHAPSQEAENYIQKIDFYHNPYAYTLFIVDNLQEWSRNLRPNESYPSYNLLGIKSSDAKNEMLIRYVLTHSKWTNETERLMKGSLLEKRRKLRLLPAPSPQINFIVNISFSTNHGLSLRPLIIDLKHRPGRI